LVGALGWRGLSAISTILIARILGAQNFGAFALLQSTMQVFYATGGARLGSASTKYIAQLRDVDPERAARCLQLTRSVTAIFSGLVASVLIIASPWLADVLLSRSELALPLTICAFQLFFLTRLAVQEQALAGFERFQSLAKLNIARGVATLAFSVPLTLIDGLRGSLIALSIVALMTSVGAQMMVRQEVHRRIDFPNQTRLADAWRERRILLDYSTPMILIAVALTLGNWIGRLFLAGTDEGLSELGQFEAANQWRTLILFLPGVLGRVFLPLVAETHGRGAQDELRSFHATQMRAVGLLALPLTVAAIISAKSAVLLYGSDFAGAEQVMIILMPSVFFFALNQPLRQLLNGTGNAWISSLFNAIWSIIFIIAAASLAPAFGAQGLAIAFLVAEVIYFAIQSLWIDRMLIGGSFLATGGLTGYSIAIMAAAVWLESLNSAQISGALVILFLLSLGPALLLLRNQFSKS
jgi:O-antigen/teichoic acid export membrane protein